MADLPEEAPDGWTTTLLGSLLTQQDRRVSIAPSETYVRLGVHWYGEGPFMKDAVPGKDVKGRTLFQVRANDFIYNRLFAWKGSFGIVPEEMDGCFVSNEFPVFVADPMKADPEYIWRYCSLPSVWRAAEDKSSGSTRTSRLRFKEEDLLKLPILLPPLPEQRAIAHVLRTVQQAKEATQRVIAATRQLKQSLTRHLFTYGPVPYYEADQVALQETEIGILPQGWELIQLGEIISDGPQNGLYKHVSHYGEGTPILRIDAFSDGDIITNQPLKCLRLSPEEVASYSLRENDIVLNRVNGSLDILAKCAVVGRLPEPTVFESNMMRFAVDRKRVIPLYLVCFLLSPLAKRQIRTKARIIHQASVNQQDIKSVVMPMPLLEVQQRVCGVFSSMDAKIRGETQRSAALCTLFQTLLYSLMTGKVRVHDVPAFARCGQKGKSHELP